MFKNIYQQKFNAMKPIHKCSGNVQVTQETGTIIVQVNKQILKPQ